MLEAKKQLVDFNAVFDLVKEATAKDLRWVAYCLSELDLDDIPITDFRDFINSVLSCANRMFRGGNKGCQREDVVLLDKIYAVYYKLMEYYSLSGYQ